MNNQYFRILFRNIRSKPLYATITLVGLTISLTASLLIYLWVFDELSFDKMHLGHERIYRVLSLQNRAGSIVKTPVVPIPLAEFLRDEFTQVETATFINYEMPVPIGIGENKVEVIPAYTDSFFFKSFTGFNFLEGDIETALSESGSIILSEKIAKLLFGNEPALGKIVESNKFNKNSFVVGGVVSIPERSHISFGYLTLIDNNRFLHRTFSNNWRRSGWTNVYLKIKDKSEVNADFISSINNQISDRAGKPGKLLYQPIADIHLFSDYNWQFDKNIGEYKNLWIFGGLAILILAMAIVNFVILITARASERFVEIGYRKIVGASKWQIFSQFISECFLQVFIALVVSIFLAWLLMPWFNSLISKSITMIPSLKFTGITFGMLVAISFVAALYPAFYLTSFNPVMIFRGANPGGSKAPFIKILVTIQSGISIFLLVFTLIIYRQINFIQQKDLGMNTENVIIIPTGLWYDNDAFKHDLLKNPIIQNVSFSTRAPADFHNQIPFTLQGLNSIDTMFATLFWVDKDFADTYGLELIEGQFLSKSYNDFESMYNFSRKDSISSDLISIPVVINETAKNLLNLSDPINTRIGNNVIIGVVKDFNFRPLQYEIGPVFLVYNPENIMTMNVRISEGKVKESISYIRDIYQKHRSERGFSYSFFEEELNSMYQSETQLGGIFMNITMLALAISMLGIFGMANYSTQRRDKEICIRKINGASFIDILKMLNFDFLKWIVIAFIISGPVAIFYTSKWLESYAYHITVSGWIVFIAGIIALVVALFSVSWQCWNASRKNPVDLLRYE